MGRDLFFPMVHIIMIVIVMFFVMLLLLVVLLVVMVPAVPPVVMMLTMIGRRATIDPCTQPTAPGSRTPRSSAI